MPILGGCLCLDLPTGVKIIGAIYIVAGLINFFGLAFINLVLWPLGMADEVIKMLKELMKENQDATNEIVNAFSNTTTSHTKKLDDFLEDIANHTDTAKIVFLILLVLAFLSVVTSSMLVHGVRRRRRGMLVPWLAQEVLHMVVGVAIIVLVFMLLGSIQEAWVFNAQMFVCILFQVFFFVVVVSQFQALGLIRMHEDEMCMK